MAPLVADRREDEKPWDSQQASPERLPGLQVGTIQDQGSSTAAAQSRNASPTRRLTPGLRGREPSSIRVMNRSVFRRCNSFTKACCAPLSCMSATSQDEQGLPHWVKTSLDAGGRTVTHKPLWQRDCRNRHGGTQTGQLCPGYQSDCHMSAAAYAAEHACAMPAPQLMGAQQLLSRPVKLSDLPRLEWLLIWTLAEKVSHPLLAPAYTQQLSILLQGPLGLEACMPMCACQATEQADCAC